ncbi:Pyruvate dehydrogenase E1, beta subunit [Trachipleistophora hominis]|uniref:Pyruvate dehydrogenase E1 component subunit beta n=1 Tax=Trachipleistophora hominis TaxID=72359 RepID=L7JU93_TRAHO|nr:Pyruvate dehydrogenase E1, beta subunit [Trachipleistophora hominis]
MNKTITPIQAINIALDEEMEHNPKIFIIGEEVGVHGGAYGATLNLQKKYGEHRVVDSPISEIGFTGLAAGAAQAGLHPVVDYMTWNFALQSIDHIINTCAKSLYMSNGLLRTPIVFRGPNGFNYGVGAQHTQDFGCYYGAVPGLKVVAPYSARDHRGCLRRALRDKNPVIFLENEVLYKKHFERCKSFDDKEYIQEFKAVVEKEGQDITLIGISLTVGICLEAAQALEEDGISVEVINLISIRPIDYATLVESVQKTRRLIIVDNSWPCFSIASEISANIHEKMFSLLKMPVERINAEDVPTPYALNLEQLSLPSTENVVKRVRDIMR